MFTFLFRVHVHTELRVRGNEGCTTEDYVHIIMCCVCVGMNDAYSDSLLCVSGLCVVGLSITAFL